jgi:hypothetical protein
MRKAGPFLRHRALRRPDLRCDRSHSVYPAIPLNLLHWQLANLAMKAGGIRATYDHRKSDQEGPGRTGRLSLAYPSQFIGRRQRNRELGRRYRRSSRCTGRLAVRHRIGARAQRLQPGFRDPLSLASYVTNRVSSGPGSPSEHFSQRRSVCLRQSEHWTRTENCRRMAVLRFTSDGVRHQPKGRTGG